MHNAQAHHSAQTLETCIRLFTCITPLYALVCRRCHCAVPRDHLIAHLQHPTTHNLRLQAARAIVEEVDRQWPRLAASTDALYQERFYPALNNGPLEHLRIYDDGLRCCFHRGGRVFDTGNACSDEICSYVVRTSKRMRDHCKEKHGWVNPRKRGRQSMRQKAAECHGVNP